MSEQAQPKKRGGWLKAAVIGMLGLGGGAAGTYATAVIDRVAKPTRPVANFAVAADGLTVTCQNRASGESGWWDFGDGTALEPFEPDQPEVKHTYTKPGNYTVKLTVRNFVADENERTVPVDLSAAVAGPQNVPAVLGFAVQPVTAVPVAPATFRIIGEVKDAEACVWDYGDGRQEVTEAGGKIDRLVTFDKPGAYTVQVFAHNGKQAVKLAAPVHIESAKSGSLGLTLRITDTGSRAERTTRSESLVVPVPKEAKGAFTRTFNPRPGYTFAGASVTGAKVSGMKNLGFAVPDGRTAVLRGEWDGTAKRANKATVGSDVIIPLTFVDQRLVTIKPVVNVVGGTTATGRYFPEFPSGLEPAAYASLRSPSVSSFELPLPTPPGGLTQHTRQFQVEVRQSDRAQPLLQVTAPSLPWSSIFAAADGRKWVCSITPNGAKAVVSFNPLAQ